MEDDGVGFDPFVQRGERHLGLLGMRERAELLGGTLTIESALRLPASSSPTTTPSCAPGFVSCSPVKTNTKWSSSASASGYVLKKAADSELLSAIKAVLRGEVYVHPSMTRVLLEDMPPRSHTQAQNHWEKLSEREREVLKMVALGNTSAEIAERLH